MDEIDYKIKIKNLYKIFGKNPKSMMPLVENGVSKDDLREKHGHVLGLNNINLEIKNEELFVIIGLSGSGKSTLVRSLNLLNDITSGEIVIDGEDVTKYKSNAITNFRRNKISMVFQKFGLLPHYTVLQNVAYGLEVKGEDISEHEQKLSDVIETVGLSGYEDYYPSNLSGGMQQRVGIARAIASDTDIILMDEAFSALDPVVRKELQDEVIELQKEMGKTVIFITHDLNEAFKIGDRVAILKDGDLVQVGTPEEITSHPANEYVESFIKDVNKMKIMRAFDIMDHDYKFISEDSSLENAKEYFINQNLYTCPVINSKKQFIGLLRYRDIINGLEENKSISECILTTGFKKVYRNKRIYNLIPFTANTKLPFVVVNKYNKLMGIIEKQTIIDLLINNESEDENE